MSSALAPNTVNAAALADELARLGIVPPERMADLLTEFPGGGPEALVDHLAMHGELTPFQAGRVRGGEAKSLVLGPYVLDRVHGPGVLGQVYRATHRPSGAAVTVRVLPLRSLWRARQAKQYLRTLAAIPAHPALVPLTDADSANGFHYLVWPLAKGRTLAERVRPGDPLPPPVAAGLLAALADALTACHDRGVVHGLVSPLAVGIGPDGMPRLLELGAGALLAQNLAEGESLLDTLTTCLAVAGVIDYAAPELLSDPTGPTAKTDQYGLAAVGYFALTGHSPHPDGSMAGRLLAQQTGRPVPIAIANPAVPPELAGVIDRMLSPDPADRFADLAEVREVLAAFAGPLLASDPAGESSAGSALTPDNTPAASWSSPAPPARDGSDASIEFDLPPEDESPPVGLMDTPRAIPDDTHAEGRPPLPIPPSALTSPPEPAPYSPAKADGTLMANPRKTGGVKQSDPRASMPKPVQWHTAGDEPADELPIADESPPPSRSALWRSLKRNLLFWQAPTDTVQVSVFGPPAVSPGQTVRVTVYLHPPDATDSVRTLSRAFQHDAELVGSGYLAREVPRAGQLAVHMFASNAAASKSLQTCVWRGTPHRLAFDLHVPWESPSGPAPALVSIGRDDVRIGKIGFNLHILPRKG